MVNAERMSPVIYLRPLDRARDLPALVAINNEGYPAVPLVEEADMAALLDMSSLAVGADDGDRRLVGFVLAMDPGLAYESENYTFFEAHYRNHLYIDRVVLADSARGAGVGSALYEAVFDKARSDGRDHVTCEVNLEPPNPGSLRFHRRWGFEDVGQQPTKGGAVVVQLLHAPVSTANPGLSQ